jgi:preprotein translocase subunit SecD
MVHFEKWKIVLILAVCVLGLLYAAPNLLNRQTVQGINEALPGGLPTRQVNLGLDLRGGVHLLLRVEWEEVLDERLDAILDQLPRALRTADIGYTDRGMTDGAVAFTLLDRADAERAIETVLEIDDSLEVSVSEEGVVTASFNEVTIEEIRSNAVAQSIQVVRRRIDEFGTTEPNIQRQGENRILVQVPGEGDSTRIRSLIEGRARLTFQLVDIRADVAAARAGQVPPGSQVLPAAETGPQGEPERYYVVRNRVYVGGENLVNAQATFQEGQPVVSFAFDAVGARRFADVTRDNVNRPLAIVLDEEVISAPNINEPILGGRGIISGQFTVEEANDLAILLRAGALPASMTVLQERTVGPSLGADSIAAGELAALIGFAMVIIFMVASYGLFGAMASLALVINLVLILAVLSLLQATLTLPGIAGIVLTVGMAVDANVLIFERIREETRQGRSPISAIDAGYGRALSTIIDANITTLIAAILLFSMGSGPIRGFAVTLSIGILTSMFTAIMVTRLMVVTWLRRKRPKALAL